MTTRENQPPREGWYWPGGAIWQWPPVESIEDESHIIRGEN